MDIEKLKKELEKNGFKLAQYAGAKGLNWYKIVPKNDNSKWIEWRNNLNELNDEPGVEDYILVLESTSKRETHIGFEFFGHSEPGDYIKEICERNNLNYEISWSGRARTRQRPFVREARIEMGGLNYEEKIVEKVILLMETKGKNLLKVFKDMLGESDQMNETITQPSSAQ